MCRGTQRRLRFRMNVLLRNGGSGRGRRSVREVKSQRDFDLKGQGCEGRATLDGGCKMLSTPTGVAAGSTSEFLCPIPALDFVIELNPKPCWGFCAQPFRSPRVAVATLGFEAKSRWDFGSPLRSSWNGEWSTLHCQNKQSALWDYTYSK